MSELKNKNNIKKKNKKKVKNKRKDIYITLT
jgi:hypothetical protein